MTINHVINKTYWKMLEREFGITPKSELGPLAMRYVHFGIQVVLGLKCSLANGCRFDKPEYCAVLYRPEVMSRIKKFIRTQMMVDGHFQEIARIFDTELREAEANGATLLDLYNALPVAKVD